MKIGSLVTSGKHWVELSPERDLRDLAGHFLPEEIGVVLENGCHPTYGDPLIRVLSSAGVVGWIGAHHVVKIA